MAITRSTEGASSLRANAREISKRELVRYVLRTRVFERAMARPAVFTEICTPEETARVIERNRRFAADCHAALVMRGMPAHVAQFGAKGCVTWSVSPVRNFRDYLATDFDLAFELDVFTRFIDTVLTPSRIDDND
jgi:glutamate-1-semialdehyde 2,1-aminomutase